MDLTISPNFPEQATLSLSSSSSVVYEVSTQEKKEAGVKVKVGCVRRVQNEHNGGQHQTPTPGMPIPQPFGQPQPQPAYDSYVPPQPQPVYDPYAHARSNPDPNGQTQLQAPYDPYAHTRQPPPQLPPQAQAGGQPPLQAQVGGEGAEVGQLKIHKKDKINDSCVCGGHDVLPKPSSWSHSSMGFTSSSGLNLRWKWRMSGSGASLLDDSDTELAVFKKEKGTFSKQPPILNITPSGVGIADEIVLTLVYIVEDEKRTAGKAEKVGAVGEVVGALFGA